MAYCQFMLSNMNQLTLAGDSVFPSKACILRIPTRWRKSFSTTDTKHRGGKTDNAVLIKSEFWKQLAPGVPRIMQ